jgi:hypothetical protein
MKTVYPRNSTLRSPRKPLNLLSPDDIFADRYQCSKSDAVFSLKVYAAAYCIFSADFRDALGPASLGLLEECATHFSRDHQFHLKDNPEGERTRISNCSKSLEEQI